MNCHHCEKELNHIENRKAILFFGIPLCEKHRIRLNRLVYLHNTPFEAIQLFYALRKAGVQPMLEWWDGEKSVHLAISRLGLHIEVDCCYERMTPKEVLAYSGPQNTGDGLTCLKIPQLLIRQDLQGVVDNLLRIMDDIRKKQRINQN